MEHPNAALIRQLYAAFEREAYVAAVAEIFADDVIWHLPGRHPAAGDHRGRDAVLAAMARFDGAVQLELHDIVASDDHAVALLRASGSRQGRTYDSKEVDVFHIADGRVIEFWSFAEDQRITDEYWS